MPPDKYLRTEIGNTLTSRKRATIEICIRHHANFQTSGAALVALAARIACSHGSLVGR